MYTKIGVELFARGIRYTIGFAMTYTEELARGYTYTARACEGVYGIQRLTVYPYHPLSTTTMHAIPLQIYAADRWTAKLQAQLAPHTGSPQLSCCGST